MQVKKMSNKPKSNQLVKNFQKKVKYRQEKKQKK
jgi:hypothetical protein